MDTSKPLGTIQTPVMVSIPKLIESQFGIPEISDDRSQIPRFFFLKSKISLMCGPDCWYCPICSRGESRDSDYIPLQNGGMGHEYRWSCRQKLCCFIQLIVLCLLATCIFFGFENGFFPPSGNKTNTSLVMNFSDVSNVLIR